MRIAQHCLYCNEFFIAEIRLYLCPFCNKELPQKEKPKLKPNDEKLLKEIITEQPSTEIIREFVEVQNQVTLLYNLVYGFLTKNNELLKSKKLDSKELCDFGFICRELENIFDELRKEVKARKELCGSIIAYRLIQASVSDPSSKMQVKGELATGIPDVKMQTALPEKFSNEYYQLTDYFGVPRKVAETGILRLDWKQVIEYCTQLMQEGKSIPAGFGKQYPLYATTYRKLKEK